MGEEVEELVKRLRERAYVIAAASPLMSDDTLRNTQVMVAAADTIESLRASRDEAVKALEPFGMAGCWRPFHEIGEKLPDDRAMALSFIGEDHRSWHPPELTAGAVRRAWRVLDAAEDRCLSRARGEGAA